MSSAVSTLLVLVLSTMPVLAQRSVQPVFQVEGQKTSFFSQEQGAAYFESLSTDDVYTLRDLSGAVLSDFQLSDTLFNFTLTVRQVPAAYRLVNDQRQVRAFGLLSNGELANAIIAPNGEVLLNEPNFGLSYDRPGPSGGRTITSNGRLGHRIFSVPDGSLLRQGRGYMYRWEEEGDAVFLLDNWPTGTATLLTEQFDTVLNYSYVRDPIASVKVLTYDLDRDNDLDFFYTRVVQDSSSISTEFVLFDSAGDERILKQLAGDFRGGSLSMQGADSLWFLDVTGESTDFIAYRKDDFTEVQGLPFGLPQVLSTGRGKVIEYLSTDSSSVYSQEAELLGSLPLELTYQSEEFIYNGIVQQSDQGVGTLAEVVWQYSYAVPNVDSTRILLLSGDAEVLVDKEVPLQRADQVLRAGSSSVEDGQSYFAYFDQGSDAILNRVTDVYIYKIGQPSSLPSVVVAPFVTYPNPSTAASAIALVGEALPPQCALTIYDAAGRKVMQRAGVSVQAPLDLGLAPGTYLLHLTDVAGGQTYVARHTVH